MQQGLQSTAHPRHDDSAQLPQREGRADCSAPVVALFPSSYAPNLGGVEELTRRLAGELTRNGGRVAVFTNRWPAPLPAHEVIDNIPVHRIAFVSPGRGVRPLLRFVTGFPRALFTVVRSLRALAPDVVHVQCVSINALYAWVGARVLRRPLVVSLQGELTMDTHQAYERSGFLPWLLRRLMRHADGVTACSQQTLIEAERLMGVTTGERGTVIHNGVDLREFESPIPPVASGRFILAIGRHVHEKGFDVLLRAFAQLARDDVRLLIAGDGAERPALAQLATELGVADRVELPGRTDRTQTVELFRACELFVLPSRHEPFGIVNVEAMASGKAIVATKVGGVPEIVRDDENGVLVPPDDPVVLAGAIRRVLDDGNLRQRLGDAGRAMSREFSWTAITREYTSVYRRLVRARRKRPVDGPGDRPYRVAFIGHTAVASGGELALARLIPALPNVEPYVLLGADGPLVALLRGRGVAVEVLPLDPMAGKVTRDVVRPGRLPWGAVVATARYTWMLSRRLKEIDPDIVHTNTLKAAVYGGLAGRLARVPVIWHIRDRIAPDYLPRAAVVAIRLLARYVPTAIIANSQATRRTLGRPRRLTAVVPSPVVYDAVEAKGGAATDSPCGPLVVGIVGRLAPWKGQDVFVRAFAEAFPEGDERALIVGGALFGEDDYAADLKALVRELGLSERVELTGHVDDVPAMLERMHIVVHASVLPEPFGQVVVEAMAAGRAVIASAEGGPAEIIRPDVDGVLIAPGDVSALASAMRRVAADRDARERLGSAAHVAVERFAPDRVGRQVEEIYASVSRRVNSR